MMDENKFWICVWGMLGGGFVILMLALVIGLNLEVRAIERLIASGTDPVLARCAIKGSTHDAAMCGARVATK
jgi:hypothetical protein